MENCLHWASIKSRLRSGHLRSRNGLQPGRIAQIRARSRSTSPFVATRTGHSWSYSNFTHLFLQRYWRILESWILCQHWVRYPRDEWKSSLKTWNCTTHSSHFGRKTESYQVLNRLGWYVWRAVIPTARRRFALERNLNVGPPKPHVFDGSCRSSSKFLG